MLQIHLGKLHLRISLSGKACHAKVVSDAQLSKHHQHYVAGCRGAYPAAEAAGEEAWDAWRYRARGACARGPDLGGLGFQKERGSQMVQVEACRPRRASTGPPMMSAAICRAVTHRPRAVPTSCVVQKVDE